MRKYFCDRCKREVDENSMNKPEGLHIRRIPFLFKDIELCPECDKQFILLTTVIRTEYVEKMKKMLKEGGFKA